MVIFGLLQSLPYLSLETFEEFAMKQVCELHIILLVVAGASCANAADANA
jgi:hypothetical protein